MLVRLVLEMKGISKAFGGIQALQNADFSLEAGQVHALVGENGAGKSTLMKILIGLYWRDAGEVLLNGQPIECENTQQARDHGIAMIHQELNFIPEMSVAENMFLGREPLTSGPVVNYKAMYRMAGELLAGAGIDVDPRKPIKTLSVAKIQLIEIIKAVSQNAKIIIMDEPTSALTEDEVTKLYDTIRRLKVSGVSIIYISHRLEEIFKVCDAVTVLRDGRWIGTHPIAEVDRGGLISMMVGRSMENIFPALQQNIGEVVFEVNSLCRQGVFQNISFAVRSGEILGVAGLMGAGRTEVARAIVGLDALDGGEMQFHGTPVKNKNVRQAIQNEIAMVSEDRKQLGLVLCRPIGENATLPHLDRFTRHFHLDSGREKSMIQQYFERLHVKAPSSQTLASSLSGGNQQKVVLAKWLMGSPKLLILDEPTRGIDVAAKFEIYELMNQLAQSGTAIIMISSELPEILGMSHRVLVMHEGGITGELSRAEATQEKIMHLATGGVV